MSQELNIPDALLQLPNVVVVCSHYGVGKTNFTLNMALDAAAAGRAVTVIDLDIVNPYFRSSDYVKLLEDAKNHVEVLEPDFESILIYSSNLLLRLSDQEHYQGFE